MADTLHMCKWETCVSRPGSPVPASSVWSLWAQPVPLPLWASRSSAHPEARSPHSSVDCLSSGPLCVPDASANNAKNVLLKHLWVNWRHEKECIWLCNTAELVGITHILILWMKQLSMCVCVFTCQCSSRSLTCCLSSLRPVRASASLSFTPINSSWRRTTLFSSGRDAFLYNRNKYTRKISVSLYTRMKRKNFSAVSQLKWGPNLESFKV